MKHGWDVHRAGVYALDFLVVLSPSPLDQTAWSDGRHCDRAQTPIMQLQLYPRVGMHHWEKFLRSQLLQQALSILWGKSFMFCLCGWTKLAALHDLNLLRCCSPALATSQWLSKVVFVEVNMVKTWSLTVLALLSMHRWIQRGLKQGGIVCLYYCEIYHICVYVRTATEVDEGCSGAAIGDRHLQGSGRGHELWGQAAGALCQICRWQRQFHQRCRLQVMQPVLCQKWPSPWYQHCSHDRAFWTRTSGEVKCRYDSADYTFSSLTSGHTEDCIAVASCGKEVNAFVLRQNKWHLHALESQTLYTSLLNPAEGVFEGDIECTLTIYNVAFSLDAAANSTETQECISCSTWKLQSGSSMLSNQGKFVDSDVTIPQVFLASPLHLTANRTTCKNMPALLEP